MCVMEDREYPPGFHWVVIYVIGSVLLSVGIIYLVVDMIVK